MSAGSAAKEMMHKKARSRVGNGRALLPGIDGRSRQARRVRELIRDLTADTPPPITGADALAIKTAALAVAHVEELAAAQLRGERVEADAMTRATNGAMRLVQAVRSRQNAQPRRKRGRVAQPAIASGSDALDAYLKGKANGAGGKGGGLSLAEKRRPGGVKEQPVNNSPSLNGGGA